MFKFNYIFAFLAVLSTVFLQTAKDIVKPSDGENCSNIGSVLRQKFGIMGRSNNGFKEETSASGKKVSFAKNSKSNEDKLSSKAEKSGFDRTSLGKRLADKEEFRDLLGFESESFIKIFFSGQEPSELERLSYDIVSSFYSKVINLENCVNFYTKCICFESNYYYSFEELMPLLCEVFSNFRQSSFNDIMFFPRDISLHAHEISVNGKRRRLEDSDFVFFLVNRKMFLFLINKIQILDR